MITQDPVGVAIFNRWLITSKLEELKLRIMAQNPSILGIHVDSNGYPLVEPVVKKSKVKLYRSIDEPWEES